MPSSSVVILGIVPEAGIGLKVAPRPSLELWSGPLRFVAPTSAFLLGADVTEGQARARCLELAASSPDRETHSWIAREAESGEWSVVRLAIPPAAPPEGIASKSPDSKGIGDDPRSAMEQNFPPHSAGL